DAQRAVLVDGVAAQQVAPAGGGPDAVVAVEGDHVAFPGGGAADDVGAGPVSDDHAAVRIGADVVAPHGVKAGAAVPEHNAVALVAGNDVARPEFGAADEVAVGPQGHRHAVGVAQGGGAGGVEADGVAQHRVPHRARVRERDTLAPVAGDQVAGDGVEAGAQVEPDALAVAQGGVAGGVGADVVALHHVAHRAGVQEHDALVAIGGDDVACRGVAAADDVAAGLLGDPDALAVAQGGVAGEGDADVVALDGVADRAGVGEGDAAPGVAGDDVAGPDGGAADRVVAGPSGDQNSISQIWDGGGAGGVGADQV